MTDTQLSEVEIQALEWLDQSPHLNQRDLGKRVGLTSHEVGRILTQQGLRADGKPTPAAFERGFVTIEKSGEWNAYRWNERRVVPLLRHTMQP
jgi:hypothetical protein